MAAKKAKRGAWKATSKKRRSNKAASAKQLAAQRKFAMAAKARGKAYRNPRYFVVGTDHAGREHDLAVKVALNKTQTLQWAKQNYPGYKKYNVTLSDKADFIGQSGMVKARRPKRTRNRTVIKAQTIQHLDVAKVHNSKQTRRKYRNGYLDLVIRGTAEKVNGVWKIGKKSIPQGKGIAPISSGYYLDKATGIIFAKRARNVAEGFYDGSGVFHPIRSSADYDGGTAGETGGKPRRTRSKKKRAAVKKASTTARHRAETKRRKATTARLATRALQRSVPLKRKRNSATTEKLGAIRQEFTGRSAGKVASMLVSDQSPSTLTKLAKFLELKLTDGRIIKPATGTTWICSDTKKRIHFATTGNRLYDGPKGDIAEVDTIAYREWKPSVGSNKTEDYEHQFGEEGGTLPMLVSDGKGGLYLRGGSYTITDAGIVN